MWIGKVRSDSLTQVVNKTDRNCRFFRLRCEPVPARLIFRARGLSLHFKVESKVSFESSSMRLPSSGFKIFIEFWMNNNLGRSLRRGKEGESGEFNSLACRCPRSVLQAAKD